MKPKPYVEPKAVILEASQVAEVSRLKCSFDRMDPGPVAPAGLYTDPRSGQEQFQLHRVTSQEGLVFTFETYNFAHPLPSRGSEYFYRGWWLQEAFDAATDMSTVWKKEFYPADRDDVQCLFSWETIAHWSKYKEGYKSKYGWVTVEAFHSVIINDCYRIRSQKVGA